MNQLASFYAMRQPKFQSLLTVIGLALLGCSFIYLIAANWWMLPTVVQLSIAPILVLISGAASVYFANHDVIRQALTGLAGLCVGLSLAVIGQVYQTGADSYLLFLVWSVMLVPWLMQKNIGVFLILMVTLQLTLFLFFKQSYYLDIYPWAYVCSVNILTLLALLSCIKYYPQLRYVFLLYIGLISVSSMIAFLGRENQYYYLVSALFLPMMSLVYFYLTKKALEVSLSALILGMSITILFIDQIIGQFSHHVFVTFSITALVVFSWCAALSWGLVKLMPNAKFHSIPLAFGAWCAGILLSSAFLTFLHAVSLLIGLTFILISTIKLRQTQHLFLRQLCYCLLICGQAAVMWHSYDLFNLISIVVLIQLLMLCLSFYLRCHWLFIAAQLIMSYLLIDVQIQQLLGMWDDLAYSSVRYQWVKLAYNLLCFSGLLLINRFSEQGYKRSILSFICAVIVLINVHNMLAFNSNISPLMNIDWHMVLIFIWIALTWHFILKPQFNSICAIAFALLGGVVALIGYFEIYVLLLILAYAQSQRDNLIFALAIAVLCFVMFLMYYNLEVSFLFKSASIFISALLVLILAYILKQNIQAVALAHGDLDKNMNTEKEQS